MSQSQVESDLSSHYRRVVNILKLSELTVPYSDVLEGLLFLIGFVIDTR